MSVSKRFVDYLIELDTDTAQAGTEAYLDQITEASLNSQLQTMTEAPAGAVYATYGALKSGAPTGSFTTTDLKTLLDECGLTGMLIDNDGAKVGVVMYMQKMAQGGTRTGVAEDEHVSVTVPNGIMIPKTLSMTHQEPASISCDIVARQDGDTAPLTFLETATLPAAADISPGVSVNWTLGKVMLNSTELDGLQSVNIDFGINLLVEAKDSDIYPTFIAIQSIRPSITISGVHIDATSTLTENGAYYAASQVVLYAKKRSEGGTFVADATAEHVKFTLGKTRVDWTGIDGDPKNIAMRLTPLYTAHATTPVLPITIATASAIT